MNRKSTALIAGLAMMTLPCLAADVDLSKLPPPSDRTGLTFTNDIEPIFKASCTGCHSGPRARSGLHLDTLEGALNGGMRRGEKVVAITPGDSEKSPLVVAVARLNPRTAMPPPPRRPRPGGPGGGTNGPVANPPPQPPPDGGAPGMAPPPPGEEGRPGGRPPPKPLTPEQVGLIRAWIDQGAK